MKRRKFVGKLQTLRIEKTLKIFRLMIIYLLNLMSMDGGEVKYMQKDKQMVGFGLWLKI